MENSADILIVDDTPANLQLLVSNLTLHGYHVRAAADGQLALMAARADKPDLILLDVMMPKMNGFEVCEILKQDRNLKDVPVIFISAADDIESKIRGFEVGGADYISKPFQFAEVLARIQTHLTLYRQRIQLESAHEQDLQYFEMITRLKDELMSEASHDLKNPLHIIKLLTDLLRPLVGEDEKGERYLNAIEKQVSMMQQLLNDVLDLLKLETGRALVYDRVNLSEFVADILEDFEFPARAKQIQLDFTPLSHELDVSIDRRRIRQVLHNLLSNALKYTPDQGQVRINMHQTHKDVTIEVEDTGLGIPDHDLPHIFEKFYRVQNNAHTAVEGTGLGLAIAKSIVEQHGGQIGVESYESQGSKFQIVLPLEPELSS